jgi:hypothetical protein
MKKSARDVQAEHRQYGFRDRERRADHMVLARLDRLVRSAPRPRKRETPIAWAKRHTAFLKQIRKFFVEHRQRLQRLGVHVEDFGILGLELPADANGVPFDTFEAPDPRHAEAEERETLSKLAEKGSLKYHRLG